MSPTHGGTAPSSQRMLLPMLSWGLFLAYTASLKLTFDLVLIIGMAMCFAAGQFIAAHAFSGVALVLLLVFVIRLCGGAISWVVTGR